MVREQIKLLALDLAIDETETFTCPFCQAKHEKKFYVTRIYAGLLYQCKRASCGAKGFVPTTVSELTAKWKGPKRKGKGPKKTKVFKDKTVDIRQYKHILYYLCAKYKLNRSTIVDQGWKYVPNRKAIWFPVRCPYGYEHGCVIRYLRKREGSTKAISYVDAGYDGMHFPVSAIGQTTAIIVEDIVSATRSLDSIRRLRSNLQPRKRSLITCALMGTNFNEPRVEQLIKLGIRDIIVALDPDATAVGYGLKRKWNLYFNSVSVKPMKYDPKDYPKDDNLLEDLGV